MPFGTEIIIRGGNGPGRPGDCSPGLPQIQTCGFPASGSSRRGFAVPRTIHPPYGDTLGGSMPSAWCRPPVHDAAPPSLHGVREGPFPRFLATMRRSDSPPSISVRFVAFAGRYHRFARDSLPSVVGVPPGAWEFGVRSPDPEFRWKRRGLPSSWGTLAAIARALRPRRDQARSVGPGATTPDAAPAYVHGEGSPRL